MMDGMGFCWFLLPLLFRVDMTPSLVCGGIQYHDIPGTGFSFCRMSSACNLMFWPSACVSRVAYSKCVPGPGLTG